MGMSDSIKSYPDTLKELFVMQSQRSNKVDTNFLFSILLPKYSPEASTRRKTEETMMDSFQDLLLNLEDGDNISSYEEAIAWNAEKHPTSNTDSSSAVPLSEQFQTADLTVAGVMGWLTGQKHKPISGENFMIDIKFNHDCLVDNPVHTICFPTVVACAKEITLPVAHMKTADKFKEVFLLAFCKGQSFARV